MSQLLTVIAYMPDVAAWCVGEPDSWGRPGIVGLILRPILQHI